MTEGYWTDIGNLSSISKANYDALSGAVRVQIDGTQIRPGVWIAEGAQLIPEAHVHGPVVLGRNATIERGAVIEELTAIGASAIVSPNARLHRTIAWEDVYVGEERFALRLHPGRPQHRQGARDGHAKAPSSAAAARSAAARPCPRTSSSGPTNGWPSGAIVSMSLIYGIKWPGSLFGAGRHQRARQHRDHARVRAQARPGVRLGAASPGQRVMTSRDAHPATRMMNRCIISGLLSRRHPRRRPAQNPLPLARYGMRMSGDAGVHVRRLAGRSRPVHDRVLRRAGIKLDKSTERKIENMFFREDFRRTPMDDVGLLAFPARMLEAYSTGFLRRWGRRRCARQRCAW